MAGIPVDKEATLREVLGEVHLRDAGLLLKENLLVLGVLGIFFAIFLGLGTLASSATGLTISDLGIPDWVLWVLAVWFCVFVTSSDRSFHEWKRSWYFPRLGWFSSLLLAAYIVGFIQLAAYYFKMERGAESSLTGLAIWLGYVLPFQLFFSTINIGHARLMEKRAEASKAP